MLATVYFNRKRHRLTPEAYKCRRWNRAKGHELVRFFGWDRNAEGRVDQNIGFVRKRLRAGQRIREREQNLHRVRRGRAWNSHTTEYNGMRRGVRRVADTRLCADDRRDARTGIVDLADANGIQRDVQV